MGRKWTTEEIKYLKRHYGKRPAKEIAAAVGHSTDSVYIKSQDIGLTANSRRSKPWTSEELFYLEEHWGRSDYKIIASRLKRSKGAIEDMACRMGLGPVKNAQGYCVARELADTAGVSHSTVYNWIKKGLPAKKQRFGDRVYYLIDPGIFESWVRENRNTSRGRGNVLAGTEHERRMRLYMQGLSDAKIAKELGLTTNAVTLWRHRNNIPAVKRVPGKNTSSGNKMETALTPSQCGEMQRFLGGLINLADDHPGKRVDVGAYMHEYRDNYAGGVEI